MKKLLLLLLAVIFTFTLAGCSSEEVTPTAPTIAGITEGGSIEVKVGTLMVDLTGITAKDQDGNDVEVKINGNFNVNAVGVYDAVISATGTNGLRAALNVVINVVALTCVEDPTQEVCKSDLEKAQEEYEGTIYNVDNDSNGTPDWQEDDITLDMGFSYYGAVDEDNAVWMNVLKFMEANPNITVTRNPQYTSGWEDGDNGLLLIQETGLLEGTLPDVFFNPKGAETYDKGMTLDLSPYVATDEEAEFITPNALSGMMTYDNVEMWGIPWQGVGPITAVNVGLLDELAVINLDDPNYDPNYDWTYAEYEEIRAQVGNLNTNNECVFPGVIDFSYFGANYFDSIPNGYRGYNTVIQRFDFARATNYGGWLEQVASEAIQGWHFWDLEETEREEKCPGKTDPWTGGVRAINTIYLWEFNAAVNSMVNNGFDIDIYPYPVAPDGGTTATYTYHDYYSISKVLEDDRVKAEAAFQLVKWLTFGEEGLENRWDLIEELNILDEENQSPFINGDLYLMDYIQGWPITSNPAVLDMHPLVVGFSEDSGGLDRYNFAAFQNEEFQYQMSNANPYPRHLPAFASVANEFEPWDIKDKMRDEALAWIDVAPSIEADLNEQIEDFLQYYYTVGD